MRRIVRESNRYAQSLVDGMGNTMEGPHWYPLTIAELRAFIAIHLYMGLYKQPNIRTYWEKPSLIFHCPIISNIMSRAQFFCLRQCLHITNPTSYEYIERGDLQYDKTRQVRWPVDAIREACMREFLGNL